MKGAGFFVGGLLLELAGFRGALWLMVALLAFVLAGVAMSLPRTLGKAKASKSFRELFAKSRSINLMAAARIFMFGSRDVWFVVGLPVFSTRKAGATWKSQDSSRAGPSATASFRQLRRMSSGAAPTACHGKCPKRGYGVP